jgi:16S rRNA (guanine527-N7)-methyltransferase
MTPAEALEQGLRELALEITAPQRGQLLDYVALLGKWNRTYNLTAVREPLAMVSHHLLDSLAVLPHLPVPGEPATIADVGSGAGLPGIPLAVARPQWRITLVEASQKKVAFLRQACIALGLANVSVHEGRVEAWRPASLFALVISRAFADLAKFVSACAHLVAPGGVLAAMKGTYPRDELERAPAGWDCARVVRLASPHLNAERHLVLCHS